MILKKLNYSTKLWLYFCKNMIKKLIKLLSIIQQETVPQHLLNDGINHYKTTKNITVVYVDGDTDILSFSVLVKK